MTMKIRFSRTSSHPSFDYELEGTVEICPNMAPLECMGTPGNPIGIEGKLHIEIIR